MRKMKLPKVFYSRDTLTVARDLLGHVVVFRPSPTENLAGRIVETEAYVGFEDKASHAHRGPTPRCLVMYGPPGFAYIYFTYGMHYMLNFVTERKDYPGAVLIRAVEPVSGGNHMFKNRSTNDFYNLTSGPGKLTKAFGLTRKHNGADLTDGLLFVEDRGGEVADSEVTQTTRVGVGYAGEWARKPWRFLLTGNPFVSRK